MNRTVVKTFKHKVGKNQFVIIKIFQKAISKVRHGNALASNAVNVKIFKKPKLRKV
ncbi:hypothetical protein [Paenibacillus oleatilyticus]|uniref:hypothetical protein n=1 Tax=Paenibacillus oleatilyticus TaxID=2594886 RepID=UPI001C1FD77F|nr:hypothetical protein [Paenibacillus oleatilyticus]MBU7315944.1 hypothetical protein [Paenibacillus oleatilyticus]